MECRIFGFGLWDLVLWLGIEFGAPALGVQSLSHWTTRKSSTLCFYFLSYCSNLHLLCLSLSLYLKHTLVTSDLSLHKHCGLKKFSIYLDISLKTEVITGAWLSQFTFYPSNSFLSVRSWGSNPSSATKIYTIWGKSLYPSWAQLICVKALRRLQSI